MRSESAAVDDSHDWLAGNRPLLKNVWHNGRIDTPGLGVTDNACEEGQIANRLSKGAEGCWDASIDSSVA